MRCSEASCIFTRGYHKSNDKKTKNGQRGIPLMTLGEDEKANVCMEVRHGDVVDKDVSLSNGDGDLERDDTTPCDHDKSFWKILRPADGMSRNGMVWKKHLAWSNGVCFSVSFPGMGVYTDGKSRLGYLWYFATRAIVVAFGRAGVGVVAVMPAYV